jgi:hypothetical protein
VAAMARAAGSPAQGVGAGLGIATDHGSGALFTIQLVPYIYLGRNCIRLESGP